MGVCPQHDILFDLLTPEEHLSVFIDFKGNESNSINKKAEIDELIENVGLNEYRHTMAKNLSGGSKRKLSVAIALCGNSKFILLDEPTSGMDLQARRNLWNTLKRYRNDKIIILTTHYMDEADVLGDRIGIMGNG
jgi:ATP-binding cassette subfamily A (ABC1) protein 3